MDSIVLKNSHSDTSFKIGKAIEDQARFLVFKKLTPTGSKKSKPTNNNPESLLGKSEMSFTPKQGKRQGFSGISGEQKKE